MNVTNCRSCGRLFNVIDGERLCPECQKKIDERFKDVKEYLHDHPDASVEELSKELKISVKQIIRWIREERLVLSNPTSAEITCESCGRPICSGRFCKKCKARISTDLMGAVNGTWQGPVPDEHGARENDRMRYFKKQF